jgi:hypothetical protein
MSEKQITLDGELVPVVAHRDDVVECSDGTECRREEVLVDCRGKYHRDEDAVRDANDEIVKELLDAEDVWIGEYVASDDYGAGYAYLVSECSHGWGDRVGEWLDDNYTDGEGWSRRPICNGNVREAIIAHIVENIDWSDYEPHYQSDEYSRWYGDGCCLDSFEVGEYEDQIEVSSRVEFKALAESGELEGCLDRYNGDLYIKCDDHYDRELGRRVRDGYISFGNFYGYSTGWGRWHYVVSVDRMKELVCAAIVEYCQNADSKSSPRSR